MDKIQIDKAVQILRRIAETGDFNYIGQLTEFIKNQGEINEKIEKIKINPEEADIFGLCSDVSTAIQSEIPEEELDYFYAEVYSVGMGLDEAFGIVGEKKEKAQSIWEKRIAERVEGKDDEEKLKISEEYDNKEIGDMALLHLSDSKKVGLLKNEGTYSRKLEKKLIESIENPNLKIEALNHSTLSEHDKIRIIMNADENFKIQALPTLQWDHDKINLIQTIKDPKMRLELINQIMPNNEGLKKQCIDEIEDPKERLEIGLKELTEEGYKAQLIAGIEDPKERLETALRELKEDGHKVFFIKEIEDPKEKLETALKELKGSEFKPMFIMETIKDPVERIKIAFRIKPMPTVIIEKTYIAEGEIIDILKQFTDREREVITIHLPDPKIKREALTMFEGPDYIEIANTLPDKEKLELLENDREENEWIIRKIKTPEVMEQAIDKLKLEHKQKEWLKRLYQKNNDVMENIDFRILDEHYIETLGEDKINLLAPYSWSIATLNDKAYKCFCKIIGTTTENESNEWVSKVNTLAPIRYGYTELIESIEDIEDIDMEKLTKIMLCSPNNRFEIKSAEDIKNYEIIKKEKCDEIIKDGSSSDNEKKNAVFMKLFGFEWEIVEKLINKFGQDIDNIDEPDLKYFIKSLDAIMQLDDEQTLKTIYEQCEEVSLTSPTEIEVNLKTAYGKKFNEGLYTPKKEDIIEEDKLPEELRSLGVKVYDAGTDFKMLVTSVGAYIRNAPKDFKKDWNRPSLSSQFFCTSYIRNDMRGTAPVPHLCYGFNSMAENSLLASGYGDIGSWGNGINVGINTSHREIYYTPEMQINNTAPYYNEMCFRRFQKGERKQPDYIVAIKKNGKVLNSEEISQAVKDWEGKIPVVILDEEKCLQAEKGKVDEMMQQYETTQDVKLAKKIIQKIKNNQKCVMAQTGNFCYELMTKLEKDIEGKINNMDTLEENYQTVTAQERQEGMSELRRIHQKIKEIREAKKGENDGREGE